MLHWVENAGWNFCVPQVELKPLNQGHMTQGKKMPALLDAQRGVISHVNVFSGVPNLRRNAVGVSTGSELEVDSCTLKESRRTQN
jgi:hypothetical protein